MSEPIRILHVVGRLNRGGTETWLLNVLRHIDRSRFDFTFLVHTDEAGAYDDDVRALGARIVVVPQPRNLATHAPQFFAHLRHEKYDIVHSHMHLYNGVVLPIAAAAGVPVRIAHAHSDTRFPELADSGIRQAYAGAMRSSIAQFMTDGLAVSRGAAACLFGAGHGSDRRVSIVRCGIDTTDFFRDYDRGECRGAFGIPEDARVIGHVGRFEEPKNHRLLLEAAAHAMSKDDRVWLMLAGDGSLRDAVVSSIDRLGIGARTILTGVRHDIPRLLCGVFDVFAMPSRWEGLPLSLIEAQAAGLPCVVADTITDEAILSAPSVQRVPLAAPTESWSRALLAACARETKALPLRALIGSSPFDIRRSAHDLCDAYLRAMERQAPVKEAA